MSAEIKGGDGPAGNQKIVFMVEDTQDGSYRDVSSALMNRGWSSIPFKKPSTKQSQPTRKDRVEPKFGVFPCFIWAINERDIAFADLYPFQYVNHFAGISKLTTKQGLCEILRETSWIDRDNQDICPRSYDLSQPAQRSEFADEFRLSAASNILKYFSLSYQQNKQSTLQLQENVIKYALTSLTCYLRTVMHGDWSGMQANGIISVLDRGDFGLLDAEWAELLHFSYQLAAIPVFNWSDGELLRRDDLRLSPAVIRARCILRALSEIWPQLYMSGIKNIWVVKAPVVSRGTGIKISYRLEEIFELERRMGGRIVQKYVENPLLVPRITSALGLNTSLASQVKFDLRIWTVVTSFQPLKAFVFSCVYGRRSSKGFSTSIKSINDELIHLTNFSIQKNSSTALSSTGNHANTDEVELLDDDDGVEQGKTGLTSIVQRLRGKVDTSSKRPPTANGGKVDLLLSQNELLDFLDFKFGGDGRRLWFENVWPEIKCRISALLLASRSHVTNREKSFELLGFDVILDDRLVPWVLEVNMSPGLSHRNKNHNALIEEMIESLLTKVLPDIGPPPLPKSDVSVGEWEPLTFQIDIPLSESAKYESIWKGIPADIPQTNYCLIGQMTNADGSQRKSFSTVLRSLTNSRSGDAKAAEKISLDQFMSSLKQTKSFRDKIMTIKSTLGSDQEDSDVEDVAVNQSMSQKISGSAPILGQNINTERTGWKSKSKNNNIVASSVNYSSNTESKDTDARITNKPLWSSTNINRDSVDEGKGAGLMDLKTYLATLQPQFDASAFLITGQIIKRGSILRMDAILDNFFKLNLIHRWARRYLIRLRLYHYKRSIAAISIQCMLRQRLARAAVHSRKRIICAILIQTQIRIYLARLNLLRRQYNRTAMMIQCAYRMKLARKKRHYMLLCKYARVIQRSFRDWRNYIRKTAAFKITRMARRWLSIRLQYRLIIRHLIALFYYRRVRCAMSIKRYMTPYLRKLRIKRRKRRDMLRALVSQARKPNKGLRHIVITPKEPLPIVNIVIPSANEKGDSLSPLFKINSVGVGQSTNSYIPSTSHALAIVKSIIGSPGPDALQKSERLSSTEIGKSSNHEPFNFDNYINRHCDGENSELKYNANSTSNSSDIKMFQVFATVGSSEFKDNKTRAIDDISNPISSAECMTTNNIVYQRGIDNSSEEEVNIKENGHETNSDNSSGSNDTEEEEDEFLFKDSRGKSERNVNEQSSSHQRGVELIQEPHLKPDKDIFNPAYHLPGDYIQQQYEKVKIMGLCGGGESDSSSERDGRKDGRISNCFGDDYGESELVDNDRFSGTRRRLYKEPSGGIQNENKASQFKIMKKKSKKTKSKQQVPHPASIQQQKVEKQLKEAQDKFAKKQSKKKLQDDLNRANSRSDAKPFITNIDPNETAWKTDKINKGAKSRTVEQEKIDLMSQAAQWDKELYKEFKEQTHHKRAIKDTTRNFHPEVMLKGKNENICDDINLVSSDTRRIYSGSSGSSKKTTSRPRSAGYMTTVRKQFQEAPEVSIDPSYKIITKEDIQGKSRSALGVTQLSTGNSANRNIYENGEYHYQKDEAYVPEPPVRKSRPKSAGATIAGRSQIYVNEQNKNVFREYQDAPQQLFISPQGQVFYNDVAQSSNNERNRFFGTQIFSGGKLDHSEASQAVLGSSNRSYDLEYNYYMNHEPHTIQIARSNTPQRTFNGTNRQHVDSATINYEDDENVDVDTATRRWMAKIENKKNGRFNSFDHIQQCDPVQARTRSGTYRAYNEYSEHQDSELAIREQQLQILQDRQAKINSDSIMARHISTMAVHKVVDGLLSGNIETSMYDKYVKHARTIPLADLEAERRERQEEKRASKLGYSDAYLAAMKAEEMKRDKVLREMNRTLQEAEISRDHREIVRTQTQVPIQDQRTSSNLSFQTPYEINSGQARLIGNSREKQYSENSLDHYFEPSRVDSSGGYYATASEVINVPSDQQKIDSIRFNKSGPKSIEIEATATQKLQQSFSGLNWDF